MIPGLMVTSSLATYVLAWRKKIPSLYHARRQHCSCHNSISASIHLLPHLQHTRPCQLPRKPRIPLRQKLTNLCACLRILDHAMSCMILQWRRPYGTILSRSMVLSSNSPSSSKLYFFSDGKIQVIYYQRLLSRIQRNHSSISPQQLAVNTLHRCIHN